MLLRLGRMLDKAMAGTYLEQNFDESLLPAVAAGPLIQSTVFGVFWFFACRFTVAPILLTAPVFALLGAAVPLAVYRWVVRLTIVERLREAEG